METWVRVWLYPPTRQHDVAEVAALARRLGVTIRWESVDAAGQGCGLAALRRDRLVWLFWLDRGVAAPAPGARESPFDVLAQCCAGMFMWPRDRQPLEQRLRALKRGSQAGPDVPAADAALASCQEIGLVGSSPVFRKTLGLAIRLARYDVPVLLEGETGTGKELFARVLHYLGARRPRPFVPVNCGALPDTLLESQLFGHARGAFTDARSAQRGLVSQAEGGTLFFDEVHCLSPKGQAVLLRFLQDQYYRPLGSEQLHRADVRIVAAANRSLAREVADGRFREDLLYRLKVASLDLPPLRERPDDIPLLVESIVSRLCARFDTGPRRLDAASLAWLSSRPWKGNVRELENFVCRAFLLSDDEVIRIDPARGDCGQELSQGAVPDFKEARAEVLRDFEARYLRTMLVLARGNVSEAARQAGKERRVFGRLMKKHGIDRGEFS